MQEVQVTQIDLNTQKIEQQKIFVAEEKPLHIFLNQTFYVSILCSPSQLTELALGHLLSEGVLRSLDEIQEIHLEKDGKCLIRLKPGIDIEKRISISQSFARLIVTTCGSPDYWPLSKLIDRLNLPKVSLGLTVKAEVISESVRRLYPLRKTGGVHIVGLYSTEGELMTFAEDVGRHNAVDKVIGIGVSKKFDFENSFLASSGRLTGDIVLKAARMGISIIASMTAAVDSGIETSQLVGITLIGYCRAKQMKVYTYPDRISLPTT